MAAEQTHVWMRHETTGGVARMSVQSVDWWHAHGWHDCDPPTEDEPARLRHPQTESSATPAPSPQTRTSRKNGDEHR